MEEATNYPNHNVPSSVPPGIDDKILTKTEQTH